jgi:thioredoxin-related protein
VVNFEQEMEQADKPILVEFSTPWCAYCHALEAEILEPLMLSDKYKDAIIIRKLRIDTYSDVIGFDGKRYKTAEFSSKYGVDLFPTLVFFDAEGREISKRVVGITVLDYVAQAVDKAIEEAISQVPAPTN